MFFHQTTPKNTGNFSAFLHGGFPQPTSLPKTPRVSTSASPGIRCEGSVFAGASWPSFRPQRGCCLTLLPATGSSRNFASRRSGGRGAIFCQQTLTHFKGDHMVVDVHLCIHLKFIYIGAFIFFYMRFSNVLFLNVYSLFCKMILFD